MKITVKQLRKIIKEELSKHSFNSIDDISDENDINQQSDFEKSLNVEDFSVYDTILSKIRKSPEMKQRFLSKQPAEIAREYKLDTSQRLLYLISNLQQQVIEDDFDSDNPYRHPEGTYRLSKDDEWVEV